MAGRYKHDSPIVVLGMQETATAAEHDYHPGVGMRKRLCAGNVAEPVMPRVCFSDLLATTHL